jgi:hypothetical protein
VVCNWNHSTWEVETGRSEVQGSRSASAA